jgi:hypothetical protein
MRLALPWLFLILVLASVGQLQAEPVDPLAAILSAVDQRDAIGDAELLWTYHIHRFDEPSYYYSASSVRL